VYSLSSWQCRYVSHEQEEEEEEEEEEFSLVFLCLI
jgi:hypothetical protein